MITRQQMYSRMLGKDQLLYRISEKLTAVPDGAEGCGKVTALYVMAPVMCMYVAWVLREACAAGIRRLYFLARDGYSMYETARIFCEKRKLPIECRYLYCSRYAWRRAEYHLLKEASLSYICLGGIDVNFRKLMSRAGLTDEEGKEIAGLTGMEKDWETPLTYRRLKDLQIQLAACRPFMEKMGEKSRNAYPSVAEYLKQEGLLEPVPWALVDSGWTGSMQKSLQHLLDSMGYQGKVQGYYFGMYEHPDGVEPAACHCWYFGPGTGLRRKANFSNSLFECIYSSPEGMTEGYEKRGEVYCPVLEKPRNPNREKILKTTDYLKRYAEALSRVPSEIQSEAPVKELPSGSTPNKTRKLTCALLKRFMGRPSPEEAGEFGSYIFCDDVTGEDSQRVAAELTPEEIRENRFFGRVACYLKRNGKRVRESAWLEGSIVRSGMPAAELWHCTLCKYVLYFRKQMKHHMKRRHEVGRKASKNRHEAGRKASKHKNEAGRKASKYK